MLRRYNALVLFICCLAPLVSCIKSFNPPNSGATKGFLVVDGVIAIGDSFSLRLSRTKNLADTFEVTSETGANLRLEEDQGSSFRLSETKAGHYTLTQALPSGIYRLNITTSDGQHYLSDFVEPRIAPPIDSVLWEEKNDIFIYVNTHDPGNNTRYYRWEFEETSEYHAVYDSNIAFRDGRLIFIGPDEMRTVCFKSYPSNEVLVASSSALSEDVINRFLVQQIANDNSKIGFRYSMLLKQFAITSDAYNYWQIIKQNSEQSGKLFDPQPSQLDGNIHCISDPLQPVIGYLSASTVSRKRIFIRATELNRINYPDLDLCKETFLPPDSAGKFLADGRKLPAYYRMSDGYLAIAPAECVDCRLAGGTTTRPSFW